MGCVIQTLMGLYGIVEVNETGKLNALIGTVFKGNLAVPHIHQSADDSFRFAVGLGTIDAGKLLADTVQSASLAESMAVSSFKFIAVIGISAVDLIRTLGNDSVYEKASGAMLSFIEKNIAISSLEKSSMATNRYSPGSLADCPFNRGSRLYRSERARPDKICYSAWLHA
jgi:hypothetical protein